MTILYDYNVALADVVGPEHGVAWEDIEALKPRVEGMQTFADTALAKQQTYIQSIAVDELKAQRDRLNTYMVQARFALASMYDRASARTTPESNRVLGEAAR